MIKHVSSNKGKDKEPTVEEIAEMAEAARLYYVEGKMQTDVGKIMDLTQTKVSKLLVLARKMGVVDIKIRDKYEGLEKLEDEIKDRFKHLNYLNICLVPATNEKILTERLGTEGARHFLENVHDTDRVGFSCGRNLDALVSSLSLISEKYKIKAPTNCKIYALVHPSLDTIVSITPSAIVAMAVRQLHNAVGYAYQFPDARTDPKLYSVQNYIKHPAVELMMNELEDLDIYYIGIGGEIEDVSQQRGKKFGLAFNKLISDLDLVDDLLKAGCVGECLHQAIGGDGSLLIDKNSKFAQKLGNHIMHLSLESLQKVVAESSPRQVIAIAGGASKHKAIYAALKAKLFNGLICDAETAQAILTRAKSEEIVTIQD